jgi:hypothetical protein
MVANSLQKTATINNYSPSSNNTDSKHPLNVNSVQDLDNASEIKLSFLEKQFKNIKNFFSSDKPAIKISNTVKYLKNDPALEQLADQLLEILLEEYEVETAVEQAVSIEAQFDSIACKNRLRQDIIKIIKSESKLHNYLSQTESHLKLGVSVFKTISSLLKSAPIVNLVCSPIILGIQSFNIGRRLLLTRRTHKLARSIEKLELNSPACQALQNLSVLKLGTVAKNDNRSTALKIANLIAGGILIGVGLLSTAFSPIVLPIVGVTITVITCACDIGIFAAYRPERLKTKLPHLTISDFVHRQLEIFHSRSLNQSIHKVLNTTRSQNHSIEELTQIEDPQILKNLIDKTSMEAVANVLKKPGFLNTYMHRKDAVKVMQDKRAQANCADLLRNWQPTDIGQAQLIAPIEKNSPEYYLEYYRILAHQLAKIDTFSIQEAQLLGQLFNIDADDVANFKNLDKGRKEQLFFEKIHNFTGKSYSSIYKMVNALA